MTTITRIGLRAALASLLVVGGIWNPANAQLTPAGSTIQNRATVNYSVGGVAQTLIESSPGGNVTPGLNAGANTQFLVDQVVDLTVSEESGNATLTSPGATAATGAVLAYTVTNDGNESQGYQLTLSEEVGTTLFGNTDSFTVGLPNLQIRVDDGNGIYDGTETATAIDTLTQGSQIRVFVLGNIPLTATNGLFANVRLQAQAAVAGTNGATLAAPSPGANTPTTIEIVFGDTGNDATESDADQFAFQSAALTVTKAATVVSDPFASASPRAVPGAIVEYTITIANTGVTGATGVAVNDPLPANTTFATGGYAGATDVAITGGAVATCVAETPLDTNTDGCYRNATDLIVGPTALGNLPAAGNATVQFRVAIN